MGIRFPKSWVQNVPLAIAGSSLRNLFALYPSRGDVTISTATNIDTLTDGPIQVVRYGALTVNAAVSAANRCRGLCILCDSLALGAAGSLSMTGKGATGSPTWVRRDILVPLAIRLTGRKTTYRDFAAWLALHGYAIFDPTLFACPLPGQGDVIADYGAWSGTAIISNNGCGYGGSPSAVGSYGSVSLARVSTGFAGNNGSNAPGGGGSGGCYAYGANTGDAGGHQVAFGGRGGYAAPWSGGARGIGGNAVVGSDAYPYGGSTPGPGGVLLIIVRGNATLASGHALTANGISDSTLYAGAVGGGKVGLYYGGALTGSPNMAAAGAAAAYTLAATGFVSTGGKGGDGHAETRTFSAMGW